MFWHRMELVEENVFAFINRVINKPVHLWKDSKGKYWLAASKWSLFRVRVNREEMSPVRFSNEADAD